MENNKLLNSVERSAAHFISELVKYSPDMIISTAIVRKLTGHICVFAFEKGQKSEIRSSSFENYIQVIHGTLEIHVNGDKHSVTTGQGFIIPAHYTHQFVANEQFKMISTVIKSGYEE